MFKNGGMFSVESGLIYHTASVITRPVFLQLHSGMQE